jgi:predicted enzyme related to lactoylglutathione lyase
MEYQGFIWAGLFVADMEEAVNFYRDVLSLPLIERKQGCALFDAGGGSLFELWPTGVSSSTPKTPDCQSLKIAFKVENLDEAIYELKSRGVQFLGEIGEYESSRWINFADPEGNRLELKEVPG